MPFTFSHPAIVLPLNFLPKRWLSLTALVIGSLTPDFEYFIRMKIQSKYSHTFLGLFWFDLPLALLLMGFYILTVKTKLINNLPGYLNKRLSTFNNRAPITIPYLLVVIISILIGAGSHLFWDSFTHPSGYFVELSSTLQNPVYLFHHQILLYNLIQHVSSFIGACIIIITVIRLPEVDLTKNKYITPYWIVVLITMLIISVLRFFIGSNPYQVGNLIVTLIAGCLLGIIVASIFTTDTIYHD